MRIVLATVPITHKATFGGFEFAAARSPPMGLAFMAALLEKHKHDVMIVDCLTEGISTYEQFKERIRSFNPELIGFTIYTATYTRAQEMVGNIKQDFPNTKIVFGGPHATTLPIQTMEETPVDYVITLEGEYTMLDLADKKDPKDILGLTYWKNRKIIKNDDRPAIKDLDKLPHPARHLLPPVDMYQDIATRSTKGNVISIISSRGCPFNCYFCNQVIGNRWRGHSVDYIFEEIDSIKEPIGKIDFEDDNFVLNRERLIEFCNRKINGKYKWKWNCYMRLSSADKEVIKLMKKAGCNAVFLGIESGNDNMLKFINKGQTVAFIREKIKLIHDSGIVAHSSFILGYPSETRETLEDTIRLACELPLDGATFCIFTPYPGTVLAEKAKQYGKLSTDWADYSDHSPNPSFVPDGFTREELSTLQKQAYKRFYLSPKFILNHLHMVFNKQFIVTAFKALRYFFQ